MKRCFYLSIIIHNFFLLEKSKNIYLYNDIAKIGKKMKTKKESFINLNNIAIISNVQLKQDFIDISVNYLNKIILNNFSITIKNKYYLLKLLINKCLNCSYFNKSLEENDYIKSFFEFIFFHYNKYTNLVLINVNIFFYISKNLLLKEGALIIIKNNIVIYQNPFLETFIKIFEPTKSLDKGYFEKFFRFIEEYLREKININIVSDLKEINFNKILSEAIYPYLRYSEELILNEIKNTIKEYYLVIDNTEIYSSINKMILNVKIRLINNIKNLYKEKMYQNYLEQSKHEILKAMSELQKNIAEMLEQINSNSSNELHSFKNNTKLINSKEDYKIDAYYLLIVFSFINFIYSYMIFINKEKIPNYVISADMITIDLFFHLRHLLNSIDELFNKYFTLRNIIINLLNIFSSLINAIFDYILLSFFERDELALHKLIIYIILLLLISFYIIYFNLIFEFYLTFESLMWVCQIIHNIIYNNKYSYPLFYIIIFTLEKSLIISFLFSQTDISLSIKMKIIMVIINIFNVMIVYIQPFLNNKFMPCSKSENNNKLKKTKEELLRQKPNANNEVCPICLGPIIDNKKYKNITFILNELTLF